MQGCRKSPYPIRHVEPTKTTREAAAREPDADRAASVVLRLRAAFLHSQHRSGLRVRSTLLLVSCGLARRCCGSYGRMIL